MLDMDIAIIKDRIAGCLWGQAIGDALGRGAEFMSKDEVEANYPEGLSEYNQFGAGNWSDDTDMMLCIAKAIIADKDIVPNTVAHNFKEWYEGSPADIGMSTAMVLSLYEYEEKPFEMSWRIYERSGRDNASNGGVMRTSVVGLWNENVAENAEKLCKLTHYDTRCTGSCVIISELINSMVWRGSIPAYEAMVAIGKRYDDRIIPYLETAKHGNFEEFGLDDLPTMGYTLKTMGCAIWCLYNVRSFKEGLLKVANAGGDADTNAAVACALLGAKYGMGGIPEHYIRELKNRNEYEEIVQQLTDTLLDKFARCRDNA